MNNNDMTKFYRPSRACRSATRSLRFLLLSGNLKRLPGHINGYTVCLLWWSLLKH